MKIVIAGGTGFLGTCLTEFYSSQGHEVVILTRGPSRSGETVRYVTWDGKQAGAWTNELNGADTLINLNGKSVDCRYTDRNKALIYATRIDATNALGKAVLKSDNPPRLWINAGSATIYRHSVDKDIDELTGEIGTGFSVDVCLKWEAAFNSFILPRTRKVIIRTGIVLGRSGPLQIFKTLIRLGLGGRQGPGTQYVSYIWEEDFVGVIEQIRTHPDLSGVFNVTGPTPIPNAVFMKMLRGKFGVPFGLPLPTWLLKLGARIIGTEPELILKSRRVVPGRLQTLFDQSQSSKSW